MEIPLRLTLFPRYRVNKQLAFDSVWTKANTARKTDNIHSKIHLPSTIGWHDDLILFIFLSSSSFHPIGRRVRAEAKYLSKLSGKMGNRRFVSGEKEEVQMKDNLSSELFWRGLVPDPVFPKKQIIPSTKMDRSIA